MHFIFDISLGQAVIALTLIGLGWRFNKLLVNYMYEHDMIVQWYCDEHGLRIEELITRRRK